MLVGGYIGERPGQRLDTHAAPPAMPLSDPPSRLDGLLFAPAQVPV